MLLQLLVIVVSLETGITPQGSSAGVAGTQMGADVSGRWVRDPASVPNGAGNNAGWGPNFEIEQSGNQLTVRSAGQPPTRYTADGSEITESILKAACYEQSRVTKTVATSRSFTITTWLVTRTNCFHGEVRSFTYDPEPSRNSKEAPTGPTKRLESVTTVARVGDELAVATTTSLPDGSTRTSSSTYRR